MRDDHLADNPACDCVGENPFETVADLNPELAVVFYYEENNAVVEALFPYLPRIGYFDAEALQVLSLKTGDRKYRDLIARLLLETGQALFQRVRSVSSHQAGVIVHATAQPRNFQGAYESGLCEGKKKGEEDYGPRIEN